MSVAAVLLETAPNHSEAARVLGVPRLTVLRWAKPGVGVRSTSHACILADGLARVRPVTVADWRTICAAALPVAVEAR